jgi:5'-methylthioadenosine phosphorylase
MNDVQVGVIGGSGFYSLLQDVAHERVDTPFGPPSAPLTFGELAGRRVTFLPRHGLLHEFPPHRIPYRANLWALHEAGVRWVLAPSASGSLRPDIRPGDMVVCDQMIDRTTGREKTFYDGPDTRHVGFADPYDPVARGLLERAARRRGVRVHEAGTMVVVEGPRFSTRAESAWYRGMGASVINMTGHPEAVLARELEMAYANLSVVTDWDAGVELDPNVEAVTQAEVARVFGESLTALRDILADAVAGLPVAPPESVAGVLEAARFGPPAESAGTAEVETGRLPVGEPV